MAQMVLHNHSLTLESSFSVNLFTDLYYQRVCPVPNYTKKSRVPTRPFIIQVYIIKAFYINTVLYLTFFSVINSTSSTHFFYLFFEAFPDKLINKQETY